MKSIFVVTVFNLTLIAHAAPPLVFPAQAGEREISECVEIRDDRERLACYDDAAGYSPTQLDTTDVGDWNVFTEKSKIYDSTNVFLTLKSE